MGNLPVLWKIRAKRHLNLEDRTTVATWIRRVVKERCRPWAESKMWSRARMAATVFNKTFLVRFSLLLSRIALARSLSSRKRLTPSRTYAPRNCKVIAPTRRKSVKYRSYARNCRYESDKSECKIKRDAPYRPCIAIIIHFSRYIFCWTLPPNRVIALRYVISKRFVAERLTSLPHVCRKRNWKCMIIAFIVGVGRETCTYIFPGKITKIIFTALIKYINLQNAAEWNLVNVFKMEM